MKLMLARVPATDESNQNPTPLESSPTFCAYPPGRGVRQDSLEALRYLVITTQELVEAIQNQWPYDRPLPPDLAAKLSFGAFAIARVRNGDLRRLAENAQSARYE